LETNSLIISTEPSLSYRHARTAMLFSEKWNVKDVQGLGGTREDNIYLCFSEILYFFI
jgi:hypothetical protein